MEKKTRSGCVAGAVLAVLILLIGGCSLVFFTIRAGGKKAKEIAQEVEERRVAAEEEASRWAKDRPDGTIELFQERLPRFEPLKTGEQVELERYLVWMLDEGTTELAREAFLETLDGAPVGWELVLEDVSDIGGTLRARMSRPYLIHHADGRGSSQSRISLVAEFDESSRDELIRFRRRDLMTLSGRLSVSDQRLTIEDATVVEKGDE